MNTTLDGQKLFDEQQLKVEPGSFGRDSVERTVAGLDGVLSIDLGRRIRKIKQSGMLRARSRTELNERINLISSYMDGDTHTLITGSGESFGNLRMDTFKVNGEGTSGGSVCCNYEIVYTQLKV